MCIYIYTAEKCVHSYPVIVMHDTGRTYHSPSPHLMSESTNLGPLTDELLGEAHEGLVRHFREDRGPSKDF